MLEYLAKTEHKGKNGTILCFAGPPGVGKTSVANNRTFARQKICQNISRRYSRRIRYKRSQKDLHRRYGGQNYVAMKEAKTKNPLILLDEIDKMGADYKGDPSAALLEVLDYEQNGTFRDHYIEVPFDLSQVLFITTANS